MKKEVSVSSDLNQIKKFVDNFPKKKKYWIIDENGKIRINSKKLNG